MNLSNSCSKSLPEGISLVSTCPICNQNYNPVQIRVLEEKQDSHLIYITCGYCETSVLAVIINGGLGVSSVGLITDLSSEDVLCFKEAEALSYDDVLDMHEVLENQTNDCLNLFME